MECHSSIILLLLSWLLCVGVQPDKIVVILIMMPVVAVLVPLRLLQGYQGYLKTVLNIMLIRIILVRRNGGKFTICSTTPSKSGIVDN
jgi:hypothetical protein